VEQQSLPSQVDAVTVYRESAVVTRRAVVEEPLPQGVHTLDLAGLPIALEDGSVRVRVLPRAAEPEGALPEVLAVQIGLAAPAAPAPRAGLREALRAARQRLRHLERERAALARRRASVAAISLPERPAPREGEAPPPAGSRGRLALLDFRRRQATRLDEALAELDRALADLRLDLAALEAEAQAGATRTLRPFDLEKVAHLRLRVPAAAAPRWELELSYRVPGASWRPSWVLRCAPDYRRLRLELKALVRQRSGEDWSSVDLTVSTADALGHWDLPELPSLRLGRRQDPPPRKGWRPPPEGTEALYADWERAQRALEPPAPRPWVAPAAVPIECDSSDDDEAPGVELFSGAPDFAPQDEAYAGAAPPACEPAPCLAPPPPSPALRRSAVPSAPPADLRKRRESVVMAKRAKSLRAEREEECADLDGLLVADAPAEPDPGIPADALLDYERLRMGGPESAHKGKLRPLAEVDLLREALETRPGGAPLPVEELLRLAAAAGQQARQQPTAPEGTVPPRPPGAYHHSFHGDLRVDLPGDGAWHSLPLLAREAEATLHHIVVPRECPDAFRSLSFVNPLQAPLLAGPADVYVGGDYLLAAQLATAAPGERVEQGLGVEPAIKTARNTSYEERSHGLLGGSTSLEHELRYELVSHLAVPAALELRERLPHVPEGDPDLELEVVEVQPPWEPYEQPEQPLAAGHRWRLVLAPGEPQTLRVRYQVLLPSKLELQGGNRREV